MTTAVIISNYDQLRSAVSNGLAFSDKDNQKQLVVHPGAVGTLPLTLVFKSHQLQSVMSSSLRCGLTCLCLHNCTLSMPGPCATESLFTSFASLASVTKIVFSRIKFEINSSSSTSDPWQLLGSAMAKLPRLETLHLLFVSTNCPITFLKDRNLRRNGFPLKEFHCNNSLDIRGSRRMIAQMSGLFEDMNEILSLCLRCTNLERLCIGTFQDGDLDYPLVGRKLGYTLVQPIQKPAYEVLPAVQIPRPFDGFNKLLEASDTLKSLEVKVCSRATLINLIHYLSKCKTLEVLIARCDNMRLEPSFLSGTKV